MEWTGGYSRGRRSGINLRAALTTHHRWLQAELVGGYRAELVGGCRAAGGSAREAL